VGPQQTVTVGPPQVDIASWLSLQDEDSHDASGAARNAVGVIEQLAQAKADLLLLAGAAQAFDLSDVHPSATSPSGVEPRRTTPRSEDIDVFSVEVGDQRSDGLLMGGGRGVSLVPVHTQRASTRPTSHTTRLERRSQNPIAWARLNDDLASASPQPPAVGRCASQ
jgi:hypothetical protein